MEIIVEETISVRVVSYFTLGARVWVFGVGSSGNLY